VWESSLKNPRSLFWDTKYASHKAKEQNKHPELVKICREDSPIRNCLMWLATKGLQDFCSRLKKFARQSRRTTAYNWNYGRVRIQNHRLVQELSGAFDKGSKTVEQDRQDVYNWPKSLSCTRTAGKLALWFRISQDAYSWTSLVIDM
jgi:hypothetical protein